MGERDSLHKSNKYYWEEWGDSFSKRMDHWGKNINQKVEFNKNKIVPQKGMNRIMLGTMILLFGFFILGKDLGLITTTISPYTVIVFMLGFYFILSTVFRRD